LLKGGDDDVAISGAFDGAFQPVGKNREVNFGN
jgi:hypothetical protein